MTGQITPLTTQLKVYYTKDVLNQAKRDQVDE